MNTEIVPFNKFTFKINDSIIDDISFMRFNSALQGKLNFNLYSNEDNFVKILEEKNEALQPMDYLDEFNSKFIHEELYSISSAFNSSAPISKSDSIYFP
jgi:hypothetical protein